MFTNISWTNYIIFVLLLLAVWYVVIGFKFYFPRLKNLFTGNTKFALRKANKNSSFNNAPIENSQLSDANDKPLINLAETDRLFEAAEELIRKLKIAVSNAASKRLDKQEFIVLLQLTLDEYAMLKNSSFQVGINDLIAKECEKYSFITLSAEELVMLWNKVK